MDSATLLSSGSVEDRQKLKQSTDFSNALELEAKKRRVVSIFILCTTIFFSSYLDL